jgi:hypothetical protein
MTLRAFRTTKEPRRPGGGVPAHDQPVRDATMQVVPAHDGPSRSVAV